MTAPGRDEIPLIGGHPLPWTTRAWLTSNPSYWIEDARGNLVVKDLTKAAMEMITNAVNNADALTRENRELREALEELIFASRGLVEEKYLRDARAALAKKEAV